MTCSNLRHSLQGPNDKTTHREFCYHTRSRRFGTGARELTRDFTLSHLSATGNKNFQDRIRAVKTISFRSLFITCVHYLYSVLPHPETRSFVVLFSIPSTHAELLWTRSKSPSYWIKRLNQSYCRARVKAGWEGRLPSWFQNPEETIQWVPGLCSRALTQTYVLTHGKCSYWCGRQAQTPQEKGPTFP